MSITSETIDALGASYARSVRTMTGGDRKPEPVKPAPSFRRSRSFLKGCGAVIGAIMDAIAFPLLIICMIASLCLAVGSLAIAADRTACEHLAATRPAGETRWHDAWVGCQVRIDGSWVPVDNWRESS